MIAGQNRTAWLLATVLIAATSKQAVSQTDEPVDFGKQIQPIFAKKCLACHGPDKSEGGLRLNKKEFAYSKLESGQTALVPKSIEHSELFKRIVATDESLRMPPEGTPLTESQVDLIKRWIEQGAEWKEHWAFEAPHFGQLPAVKNVKWVLNPVDAFVLSKLEQSGLVPAPPLEKESLLRRVTYDLTGLPPSSAEVASFMTDQSPEAYDRVVDRLLQSPHYGEHWARHWLDVVRYADTNSYERDGPKPNAWRYRDYVIRSFNGDKPYDRFIREQLAGDELPDGGADGLIATGFYRLGLWDDEPSDPLLARYDVLDDLITTTGQGFLGLTVNCARCHDHKIDPITTQDYYSLLSFFQGVTPNGNPNPNVERPIFQNEAEKQTYDQAVKIHQERLNAAQAAVSFLEKEFGEKLAMQGQKLEQSDLDDLEYRFYRDTWDKLPDFDNMKPETKAKLDKGYFDLSLATREFAFGFVFRGVLKVPADGEYTFTVDSDDGSRLTVDGKTIVQYDGVHRLGQPRQGKIALKQGRVPIRLDYFKGETGPKGLIVKWSGADVNERLLSAPASAPKTELPTKKKDLAALMSAQGPTLLGQPRYDEYLNLKKQLDELKKDKVEANFALCVTEVGPTPPETVIFKRGNPLSHGDKVVPAYLSSLGGGVATIPPPTPNATSSGRRTVLANWIASPENQLTGRVMMNRLWQHHFGRGIVRSPNNFGLLGDRPTHPELLDWLAIEFVKGESATNVSNSGQSAAVAKPWTLKRMHKLILTSNTYRMSSRAAVQPASTDPKRSKDGHLDPHLIDPMNNLFWRHDMRRLNAEEIRDSILMVSGRLNPKMYGPGVFPEISDEVKAGQSVPGQGWGQSSPEEQSRRSIYVQVKRSLMLPILSDFDFPDTDGSCAARFSTTQPTQALGMLNGKFLNEQAVDFAKRLRREAGNNVTDQVGLAYRIALSRTPDHESIERGLKLIEALKTKHGLTADRALDQFCLMVLNLNEFAYLD